MSHLPRHMAEILSNIGVRAAYGEPVELEATTLLPVALTSYGFGAGEHDPASQHSSATAGGGSGGLSIPVGAYLTCNGVTRFEPNTIALLAVSIPLAFVTGRSIVSAIRALRR